MNHFVYVYGTLRPGGSERHMIPGTLYRVGWFPGIKIDKEATTFVIAEKVQVDDAGLARLDAYEGYDPNFPETSLFRRIPWADGFIYEYNDNTIDREVVAGGDWLAYRKQERGPMSDMVTPVKRNHHDDLSDYCCGLPAAEAVGVDDTTQERAA